MELLQEAEIGAVEQTNVVNAVAHHNESVKTDIYVKARVLVGVKSCRTKYVGVRSSAGHDLDPADVLANAAALAAANEASHIDLKAGLNEGEEACSHSYGNVLTEHLGENALDHDLTCGIGEILVNDECFVLEEGSLVASVGGLVSVNATGVNEAIGGLVCLHISYAIAREVRTETKLVVSRARIVSLEPIGVHALTCGVVRREIQIVERVVFACDLGAREHLKAHRAKGVVEVVAHLCDGVKSADLGLKAGDGAVEVCGDLGCLELESLASALDLLAEKRLDVVDSLTHLGAERDVKLGDLLEKLGDASLLTEKRALYLLKLGFGLCRFDLGSTFFK